MKEKHLTTLKLLIEYSLFIKFELHFTNKENQLVLKFFICVWQQSRLSENSLSISRINEMRLMLITSHMWSCQYFMAIQIYVVSKASIAIMNTMYKHIESTFKF